MTARQIIIAILASVIVLGARDAAAQIGISQEPVLAPALSDVFLYTNGFSGPRTGTTANATLQSILNTPGSTYYAPLANPTFTGTINGAAAALSGALTVGTTLGVTGAATLTGGGTVGSLLTFTQPASLQFNGTRTWSGSQGAVGYAEIYSYTNQSGTTTGNPVAFHYFSVASDTVTATHGAHLIEADLTTGAGITGFRDSYFTSLTVGGTPADASSYVAGDFHAQASAAAYSGGNNLFGINPTCGLNAAATGSWTCVGDETDLAARTGSTPTQLTGFTVVLVSGHAAHGSLNLDSAISIGSQTSVTTGWDYGIRFGLSGNPTAQFVSTATLIDLNQAETLANGIDLHAGTFTGNTWNDGHVTISGSGVITMPLTTGTPSTYACFTSGGTLISSATAC